MLFGRRPLLVTVLCATLGCARTSPGRRSEAPPRVTSAGCQGDRSVSLADLDPLLGEAILRRAGAVVRTEAGERRRDPTCRELASIDRLQLGEVATLRGLERLPALNELSVVDVRDGDLSPLIGLPLRRLSLGPDDADLRLGFESAVHDFRPLSRLERLEELRIVAADLGDPRPIAGLMSLRQLVLRRARLVEIRALQRLHALEVLILDDNAVVDLSPLVGLGALRELRLARNPVTDLTPLAGLSRLEMLVLDGARVAEIGPIVELPALRQVVLCGTPVLRVPDLHVRNQDHLERLRRRGVAVPDLRGCTCC